MNALMVANDGGHRVAASDVEFRFGADRNSACTVLCTPVMGMSLWG